MNRRPYNKPAVARSWPLWLAPVRLVFATGYKIVGCRFETMYSRASFGGERKARGRRSRSRSASNTF